MLLSLISAILLIFAFPNFNLSFLAYIAFVPLFFAVQNKSPKNAFLISYVCGFLFYLGTLYWLYHVTVLGLVVLCLYLALYFGIFGIFTCYLLPVTCYAYLLFPALWIALEYIQAHAFTGFGWALLGYSQYKNLPLIQIADFSGVYGVSFVIMMVNVAIVQSAKCIVYSKKNLRYALCPMLYAMLILSLVYGYGFFRLGEKRVGGMMKVSVIQGNIPQNLKWDPGVAESILAKYSVLTRRASLDCPDLIIWPETAFPGFLVTDRRRTSQVLNLVREIKTPLLLGANTEDGLETFNSAVLISERGKIIDKYDKIHLVPFGEYVPFSDRFPILHNLVLGELGEFTPGGDFKVFSFRTLKRATPHQNGVARFSVLICYEDIFPELAKKFVQNGADFLVVITNDAWYGKSGAPYQHAACSAFRAIENRVPIVRCANTGYSCFIDKTGKIYDAVEKNGTHLFITGNKTAEVLFK